MAAQAEENTMQAVMTGMAMAAAAASESRTRRYDQLAHDSAAMWSVHMTTPTVMAGMGFRVAQQKEGWPADQKQG